MDGFPLHDFGFVIESSLSAMINSKRVHLSSRVMPSFVQVTQLHTIGFIFLLLAPTSLGAMNFFWFYKIVSAVLRSMKRKRAC